MFYVSPVVIYGKVGHYNMSLTFNELCEELAKLDETTLLEVLDITSDELVAHFQDKIEDNYDKIAHLVDAEHEDMIDYDT